MSVGLLISSVEGQEQKGYVPVATEQFFVHHWRPLIDQLGLEWLSLMQAGFPLTEEDVPYVLAELRQLRQHLAQAYPVDSEVYAQFSVRLTTLITELSALEGKKADLFLG